MSWIAKEVSSLPLRLVAACAVCLAAPSLAAVAFAETTAEVEDQTPPKEQIKATYSVGLAAIKLGTLDVTMSMGRKGYQLNGRGEFSLLAGLAYQGDGKTQSRGKLIDGQARPQRFDFSYEDNRHQRSLKIAFAKGAVDDVTRKPKKRPDKRAVPIPDEQLADVLDPMAAAFIAIHSKAEPGDISVCDETLRVFDGKRRFDLKLSPKRKTGLSVNAPMSLPAAAVCRVRYQPIGGHRPDNEMVTFLQESEDIEAWLVPVPGTDMVLPFKVVVPTNWGEGVITLTSLKANTLESER